MKNSRLIKKIVILILPVVGLLVLNACGSATYSQGIPPEQATIWALNTQLALQKTFTSLTLTAAAGQEAAAAQADPGAANPVATATPTPGQLNASSSNVTVTVKSNNVKMREGPDLRFATNGDYAPGTQCSLLARYGDWFMVKCSDGNQGWLYADWLNIPSSIDLNSVQTFSISQLPPACKKYCK